MDKQEVGNCSAKWNAVNIDAINYRSTFPSLPITCQRSFFFPSWVGDGNMILSAAGQMHHSDQQKCFSSVVRLASARCPVSRRRCEHTPCRLSNPSLRRPGVCESVCGCPFNPTDNRLDLMAPTHGFVFSLWIKRARDSTQFSFSFRVNPPTVALP